MFKDYLKNLSWDSYSKFIIAAFSTLYIARWPIMPQFMDIHYHLLTAWGFFRSGGYSGWDFWQYAPFGRIHIYPPLFHIILAILMKLGINTVILAKLFEAVIPVLFLIVLWYFIRNNFNDRMAFFVVLAFGSSFAFYFYLSSHIPAAIAFIFGFLAVDRLLHNKFLKSLLLLTLSFYTHIGVSWLFAFSLCFWGLLNKQYRKSCFVTFISALILSLPVLIKQLIGLRFISVLGFNLKEAYVSQIKIFDYLLALFGLILIFKQHGERYKLFLSFFLASFIFLLYPYRFFSAEGYLPIIFLSATCLHILYGKLEKKNVFLKRLFILAILFILILSPTLSMSESAGEEGKGEFKIVIFDSALTRMVFPKSNETIWFPDEYLSASAYIKINSDKDDIIYSNSELVGVILAGLSGRATANALFPEIKTSKAFNPILTSKILIFTQPDNKDNLNRLVAHYNLIKIGENKLFIIYKNPATGIKANVKKASVNFVVILLVGFVFITLFYWPNIKNSIL